MTRTITLLLYLLCMTTGIAKEFKIVASIPPVQALVKEVVGDKKHVEVLLAAQTSAHGHSLRPSDRKLINEADRVYWIGPTYEEFLAKIAARRPSQFKSLQDSPGIHLLPLRTPHHHHGHRHHHHDHNFDGHIWLDPDYGAAMATAIARDLAQLDPEGAAQYIANAEALGQRLTELKAALKLHFQGVKDVPVFTFHDGYQYLERAMDLPTTHTLTHDPDQPIAPKVIKNFKFIVQKAGSACVIREHQFPHELKALKNQAKVHQILLNPYGDNTHTQGSYERLLTNMAEALAKCMQQAQKDMSHAQDSKR